MTTRKSDAMAKLATVVLIHLGTTAMAGNEAPQLDKAFLDFLAEMDDEQGVHPVDMMIVEETVLENTNGDAKANASG